MSMPRWLVVTLVLASAGSRMAPAATAQEPTVNPTGAAVHGFQKRVAEYVKLRDAAESKVPSLRETSDPKAISGREVALGEAIRGLRADARPGDVFGDDFRAVLLKVVREDFADRSSTDRKALLQEMPARLTLTVNMTYPSTLPLVTVPAKLLSALPDLPPGLEYRIVGRHLILRDVKANIVVDFARDVVPTIPS